MEITHLLDTNILSELIRNPGGIVRDKIAQAGAEFVGTSIIVAAEIRFGCLKRNSRRLTRQANSILSLIPVLPIERGVDSHYARIRLRLETKGQVIGPNDMLIAAHALHLGCTLVTENTREFQHVHGLTVENWLS
jgi:tRNA(fMet)-specific endonuclease VapC